VIALDGNTLSLESMRRIVEENEPVELAPSARKKLNETRAHVDKAALAGERVYSINTGFGVLSKVRIPDDKLDQLQVNLIRSHCAGVGEPHTEKESRAILLLRANVLAKGFSGVRAEVADALIALLNHRIHPVIPTKGSVGASGDLAPLAHLAAVLIGEGEAFVDGKRLPGGQALQNAGLKPVRLAPKEGLSLINGTQQMTAMGALLLLRAEALAELADLVCATSLDGVLGTPRAYEAWVHATRPFPGQVASAKRLKALMQGSEIYQSHRTCDRVQDPYSFRCAPQVHGACRDLFSFVRNTLQIEMNAATDNPLVESVSGEIISQGNFHGQPIAFALDILAMGLAELGSLSERRIAKLIDPSYSELPCFLVMNEGLNSGFMIAHVTAAALVAESKLLTHPASTDSIPTNNEKEDHVSMGPLGARKAKTILENTETILAIEMLAASQALEFRKPLKPGVGPDWLWSEIRKRVPALVEDRALTPDIEGITHCIRSGELFQSAVKDGIL
jgi:histidine ammonia-lyase